MEAVLLHEFVAVNREEIIRRCRSKVATRVDPAPTAAEIDHGVPQFLNQLVDTLRLGLSVSPEISRSAVLHGHHLLLQGFTVSQVVHDYGDVCQSITDLAVETEATITSDDFRTLNRCLDDAIAGAVTEYGRNKEQFLVDTQSPPASDRLAVLSAELRALTSTALIAFDVLQTGNVGVAGSTGGVLRRSLTDIDTLIRHALVSKAQPGQ